MTIKDDQIEFHELGNHTKSDHAFHSDGYKIKESGVLVHYLKFYWNL